MRDKLSTRMHGTASDKNGSSNWTSPGRAQKRTPRADPLISSPGGDHRRPAPGLVGVGWMIFSPVAIRGGAGTPRPRSTVRSGRAHAENRPGRSAQRGGTGRGYVRGSTKPRQAPTWPKSGGGCLRPRPWPFAPHPGRGRTSGSGWGDVSGCPAPKGSGRTVWPELPGPTMPRRPSPKRSSSCCCSCIHHHHPGSNRRKAERVPHVSPRKNRESM